MKQTWLDRDVDQQTASVAEAADLNTDDGFSAWVAPHWTAMARLAARLSGSAGEDVLQDALTSAWRQRSKYDPARGSARNWLLALTADQARKNRRRSARHATAELSDDQPAAQTSPRDIDVERALTRLSNRQQLVVALYYYLGLPVADTAVVMGCAEGTVKSTLADARARLRQELGDDYA
jgi:RNA polymerase sigma-70 factor (ECF subfamily)